MYRRREPPDSMSLRYADMSLADLLGRSRLRYAEKSLGITSKCAFVKKTVFSTSVLNLYSIFFQIYQHSGMTMRGFSKIRSIYQLS